MNPFQKKPSKEKDEHESEAENKSSIFSKITSFGKQTKENAFGEFRQTPLMDLIERKNDIVLKADLPGVTKDDVTLEIQDRLLTVRAECLTDIEEGIYVRRERFYRKYEGSVNIPVQIDEEKATAKLANGVLTVFLPKKIDTIEVED
ncbi:Hsp20/alpha crystallin family protein [Methanimicrococcus blatticola]|uniref:HSP20 family protein n=1 Tax=Methanimicrococcus blatticola TaxID=91560 RepID=A0A484F2L7_9EURY|nr:Hsp20/alpha crystallin family protein [Methanimicrococcus blatticola]MBZ3935353.1 Hsp20/alpha crystallin family protein [Methanimicrococcus blatticola]MCC2508549.1 Hsp20/alpha crystallin family protein [Methanimicrococcus blatticola]TDQ67855.1 HSP20 family protein [Methanimicrococcus blatticola]